MNRLDLEPDDAAVVDTRDASATVAYRTILEAPYLTLNPMKSLIMVWIPLANQRTVTVVLGDQFVMIRLLRLEGPAPIIRLEAHEPVRITRLQRAPALTAS